MLVSLYMTKQTVPNIAKDLKSLLQPVSALKPMEGNPRRGDVEAVKKSYAAFGQRKPIVAQRNGTVIAGNHQLAAALELGWDEIAVVYVDDDETTAKAFSIADNRTHDLGSYDEQLLAEALQSLSKDLDDMTIVGYTDTDVDVLVSLSGIMADQNIEFLGDFTGEQATIHGLASPDHDVATLSFVMSQQRKSEILDRLRIIMQENDIEMMSDALYFLCTL